jgi:very-short-patch-repair endonuclease
MRALEEKEKRTQSSLEREVMKRLMEAGYRVAPQWRVGSFRIDLVVEGGGKRLAIECDGDRYHPLEKLSDDMVRQSVLERMGWIFTRIRGTEFFRHPERAMKPVFEKLQSLEIPPTKTKQEPPSASSNLIDRVVRRAEELRDTWTSREPGESRRQASLQSAGRAAVS